MKRFMNLIKLEHLLASKSFNPTKSSSTTNTSFNLHSVILESESLSFSKLSDYFLVPVVTQKLVTPTLSRVGVVDSNMEGFQSEVISGQNLVTLYNIINTSTTNQSELPFNSTSRLLRL